MATPDQTRAALPAAVEHLSHQVALATSTLLSHTFTVAVDADGWGGSLEVRDQAGHLLASGTFERDGAGRLGSLDLRLASGLGLFLTGATLADPALAALRARCERRPGTARA